MPACETTVGACQAWLVLAQAALDDGKKRDLQGVIQSYFKEWLMTSGNMRQVQLPHMCPATPVCFVVVGDHLSLQANACPHVLLLDIRWEMGCLKVAARA